MNVIRYSPGFKIKLVQEAEEEGTGPYRVSMKYGVSISAMMEWVRRYGSGRLGKVIRVQTPDDVDEIKRLKRELQLVKEALADAHVDLGLEKAYLEMACEELGQSLEGWKKKRDGRRLTGRKRPGKN